MKKIKEMFKRFVDNLIIKNRYWLEKHYEKIAVCAILLFITTSFIGCFVHAPKIMFTILAVELVIIMITTQLGDYINEILD